MISYQRPRFYPAQQKAIFHPKRYGLIEGSTKSGKTYGLMGWLLEQAIQGKAGQNFWWVAPIYKQAVMVHTRFKGSIPNNVYSSKETPPTLTLANGAVMWFLSGEKPDNLYGDDVHAAVIDEASRMREEAWHAVRTTLTATGGAIRIIGNVKGRGNWFYKLCRIAESGSDPTMEYHKLVAADAVEGGVLSAAEIEDAKRKLPEHVFRELYMAEPADDGGNPFGLNAIRNCVKPLSSAQPVAWGIDLAKSQDWTVAIGLDASGITCRVERFQRPWRDTIRVLRDLVQEPALVDSTGVGDPVLEGLQEGRLNFEGYKFTGPSKQQLMEGLAVAIQSGSVGYPDGPISNELETFEYEYKPSGVRYSAPEGLHDDCVCALALAVRRKSAPIEGMGIFEMYRERYSNAA